MSLGDGIRRAVVWLDSAPPARREMVFASPFPIDSLTDADIGSFLRLSASASIGRALCGDLYGYRWPRADHRRRSSSQVRLTGARTLRRGGDTRFGRMPIEICTTGEQAVIDAAIPRCCLSGSGHHRQIVARGLFSFRRTRSVAAASAIPQPWMAGGGRIARDLDLPAAPARVPRGLIDARWTSAPGRRWSPPQTVGRSPSPPHRPTAWSSRAPRRLGFGHAGSAAIDRERDRVRAGSRADEVVPIGAPCAAAMVPAGCAGDVAAHRHGPSGRSPLALAGGARPAGARDLDPARATGGRGARSGSVRLSCPAEATRRRRKPDRGST